jgi:hypothetical protein
MKVLSLDIGIKNLAFCLLEKPTNSAYFSVTKWDTIDVSEESNVRMCEFVEKNKICNKPAKYKAENMCFCLKHCKKLHTPLHLPTEDLNLATLKKQKFQTLLDTADKHSIPYQKPIKKGELIEIVEKYINEKCFKEITTRNASKIDLITIGKNIKIKFNKLFLSEGKIDYVIIENQISPIANRMKTIQGMVVQYFVMNDSAEHIEFVSACNKLKEEKDKDKNKDKEKDKNKDKEKEKDEDKENNTYSGRKKMGIQKCLEILNTNHSFVNQTEHFLSHRKKDDLADSFLQGLWFIREKLK